MRPRDLDLESQGQGHLKVIRAKTLQKMRFFFPIANTLSVEQFLIAFSICDLIFGPASYFEIGSGENPISTKSFFSKTARFFFSIFGPYVLWNNCSSLKKLK